MLVYLICLICRRSNSPLFRIDNTNKHIPTIWICPDCQPKGDTPIDFKFVLNQEITEKQCFYDWCRNYCLLDSCFCAVHSNITDILQKQIIAFSNATHPELGQNSPIQIIDQYTIERICDYLIDAIPYQPQQFNELQTYQIFLLTRPPIILHGLD